MASFLNCTLFSYFKSIQVSLDRQSFEAQLLFGGSSAEAGVCQQTDFLAMLSIKLRLVDLDKTDLFSFLSPLW